jgi:hypothetical protein
MANRELVGSHLVDEVLALDWLVGAIEFKFNGAIEL